MGFPAAQNEMSLTYFLFRILRVLELTVEMAAALASIRCPLSSSNLTISFIYKMEKLKLIKIIIKYI